MDFAINLTLVVQALNFLVALFIVNKLFLSPAVVFLLKEAQQKIEQRNALVEKQEKLAFLKETRARNWKEFQRKLKGKLTSFKVISPRKVSFEAVSELKRDIALEEKTTNELAQLILKKVIVE